MAAVNIHVSGVPAVTTGQLSDGRRWVYVHIDDTVTLHLWGENETAVASARAWAASLTEAADQIERELAAQPVAVEA